jgi:hypothetical protein
MWVINVAVRLHPHRHRDVSRATTMNLGRIVDDDRFDVWEVQMWMVQLNVLFSKRDPQWVSRFARSWHWQWQWQWQAGEMPGPGGRYWLVRGRLP